MLNWVSKLMEKRLTKTEVHSSVTLFLVVTPNWERESERNQGVVTIKSEKRWREACVSERDTLYAGGTPCVKSLGVCVFPTGYVLFLYIRAKKIQRGVFIVSTFANTSTRV